MKWTTDTYTDRRFYWNTTVSVEGVNVPAKETEDNLTWLHPERVDSNLLKELNPS